MYFPNPKGIYESIKDLATDKNFVITPSSRTFSLDEKLTVASLQNVVSDFLKDI